LIRFFCFQPASDIRPHCHKVIERFVAVRALTLLLRLAGTVSFVVKAGCVLPIGLFADFDKPWIVDMASLSFTPASSAYERRIIWATSIGCVRQGSRVAALQCSLVILH
jgi:hypothetical protein